MSIPRTPSTGAYSVSEFCRAHGISESTYRRLQKQGLGPRVFKVGQKNLVSVESAAAWRHRMEIAASIPEPRPCHNKGTDAANKNWSGPAQTERGPVQLELPFEEDADAD